MGPRWAMVADVDVRVCPLKKLLAGPLKERIAGVGYGVVKIRNCP